MTADERKQHVWAPGPRGWRRVRARVPAPGVPRPSEHPAHMRGVSAAQLGHVVRDVERLLEAAAQLVLMPLRLLEPKRRRKTK